MYVHNLTLKPLKDRTLPGLLTQIEHRRSYLKCPNGLPAPDYCTKKSGRCGRLSNIVMKRSLGASSGPNPIALDRGPAPGLDDRRAAHATSLLRVERTYRGGEELNPRRTCPRVRLTDQCCAGGRQTCPMRICKCLPRLRLARGC